MESEEPGADPGETPEAGRLGPRGDARKSILDTVRRLAFPRLAGGPGERRAGRMVHEELEAAGLEVRWEPFRTARHAVFRLRLLAHGLGALLIVSMALVAPDRPGAAAALGLGTLALLAGASRWPRRVEGAFDLGEAVESGNVVARRSGGNPEAPCVVIVAHRDTKSSRWPTLVPGIVMVAVFLFLVAGTVLALGAWGRDQTGPALLPSALTLAALLIVVTFNPAGDESPGAMDNASGVAVLLAAARDLAGDPELAGAELRFVCTGAEELGLAGALRWIQAHAAELDPRRTVFVNVDSVGVGRRVLAADVHGFAPGGRPMGAVVRQAARATGVPFRRLRALPASGVDTMPIRARGFATVTLLGEVLGRAAWRIHSPRDTVEHLSETGLDDARRLVGEIVREVVRQAPR